MSYKITYREEAEQDIDEAAKWYEKQSKGLGFDFLAEVEKKGLLVESNPFLFVKIYKSLHRAVVERFPFNIFYLIEGKSIIVVAVIHGTRHPKKWQKRI